MSEEAISLDGRIVTLTTTVIKAYVAKNAIRPFDVFGLIVSVHSTMCALNNNRQSVAPSGGAIVMPTAVEIRKSIGRDGLVSFIDGESYKTLKRHLKKHGLDPRSYRQRYGLPADYPMVAPAYSLLRSSLAKSGGLGSAKPLAKQGKADGSVGARMTSR